VRRWAAAPEGLRDAAALLPLFATILLLPPVVLVFATPASLAGIPVIVVYVFTVWAAIVLSAWLLARGLARSPDVTRADVDAPPEVLRRPSPDDADA
jgi:hypothetical protein